LLKDSWLLASYLLSFGDYCAVFTGAAALAAGAAALAAGAAALAAGAAALAAGAAGAAALAAGAPATEVSAIATTGTVAVAIRNVNPVITDTILFILNSMIGRNYLLRNIIKRIYYSNSQAELCFNRVF